LKSFNQYFDERTETLEHYAMLLVISGEQPEARLEWFEQMYVEDFAMHCEDEFNLFFKE
jgi:hypothetical protein